nr:alpha/beta fold hydrolase [Bradyrhizobium diazoefficiens]
MQAAGHRLVRRTYTGLCERTHLANLAIDLETHILDILNVIAYEDLHDIVLIGHSYGGMVATGVADRARDRIQQLIYLDAFVPENGKSMVDYVPESNRQNKRESARLGDGWRVPPDTLQSDASEADVVWYSARCAPMPIKCFESKLMLCGGELTLPRTSIYAT